LDWRTRLRNAWKALHPIPLEAVKGPSLQEVIYALNDLAKVQVPPEAKEFDRVAFTVILFARDWRTIRRVVDEYWAQPGADFERRV